jgi:hypothetical protein
VGGRGRGRGERTGFLTERFIWKIQNHPESLELIGGGGKREVLQDVS